MNIINQIADQFSKAFASAYPELNIQENPIEITRSTHERFGHYQCNSAMKLTKTLKMPPRDISSKVIEHLSDDFRNKVLQQCEIAGPGFINITLSSDYITSACQELFDKGVDKTSHPQKIIID